jgi:hypothetical protein
MKTLRSFFAAVAAWFTLWAWRRAWLAQVNMPWPIFPDQPANEIWQEDDAAALRLFLGGPTGTRLVQALQRMEYDTMVAASLRAQPQGRNYAAGYAAGSRNMAAYMMTLSAARPEAEQSADETAQGEASLRARYAP